MNLFSFFIDNIIYKFIFSVYKKMSKIKIKIKFIMICFINTRVKINAF